MKILMTGAHLTPALAMIDFIKKHHPEDEIVFVGRLYSQENLRQKSVEKLEVEKRAVRFLPFQAPKFVGKNFWQMFQGICLFPGSLRRARKILLQEKIEVYLSFGSYLAVPFALAAKNLHIPVVTHEQTVTMGRANQFIASVADRVAISFPQTARHLANKNSVLTGNPLRQQIFEKKSSKPVWFRQKPEKILLVMGGNQGSFALNQAVETSLPELLKNYQVVHQCGRSNNLKNWQKVLETQRQTLAKDLAARYFVREWLSEEELGWLYQHADLALSRAGANSVQELMAVALPSILVPLPNTFNREQEKNAEFMRRRGGAVILSQEELTEKNLLKKIAVLESLHPEMRRSLREKSTNRDAAAKLYQVLAQFKGGIE